MTGVGINHKLLDSIINTLCRANKRTVATARAGVIDDYFFGCDALSVCHEIEADII